MKLLMFTCSTINDRFLFDQAMPWKYVSLNPKNNNLEADLPSIKRLSQNNQLTIIIGNTDPYYIYSQSFTIYSNLTSKQLWPQYDRKWKSYKKILSTWLISNGITKFNLISWREFENNISRKYGISFEKSFNKLLPNIGSYYTKRDFAWELSRLKKAFTPQGYFKTLPCPDNKTLRIWVRRKFTEYTLQGLLLYIFFPNYTLVQNEKPTTLRNRMYQPLINMLFNSEIPIICPFGIDDAGYQ